MVYLLIKYLFNRNLPKKVLSSKNCFYKLVKKIWQKYKLISNFVQEREKFYFCQDQGHVNRKNTVSWKFLVRSRKNGMVLRRRRKILIVFFLPHTFSLSLSLSPLSMSLSLSLSLSYFFFLSLFCFSYSSPSLSNYISAFLSFSLSFFLYHYSLCLCLSSPPLFQFSFLQNIYFSFCLFCYFSFSLFLCWFVFLSLLSLFLFLPHSMYFFIVTDSRVAYWHPKA